VTFPTLILFIKNIFYYFFLHSILIIKYIVRKSFSFEVSFLEDFITVSCRFFALFILGILKRLGCSNLERHLILFNNGFKRRSDLFQRLVKVVVNLEIFSWD